MGRMTLKMDSRLRGNDRDESDDQGDRHNYFGDGRGSGCF